jgi:hypothetical protein
MNLEYDRKEDLEYIKGTFNIYLKDADKSGNDAAKAEQSIREREQMENDRKDSLANRQQKYAEMDRKERELQHNMSNDKAQNALKAKQINVQARKAKAPKAK